METFVILSRLTDHGAETIRSYPERVEAVNADLADLGVQVKLQYALLGAYDFVTIVEAPNAETVMRAATDIASHGSVRVQTFRAIPMDKFTEIFEDNLLTAR